MGKFARYVYQEFVLEGIPSKEHAEFHGVAVREGEVHVEDLLAQLHGGLEDEALFGNARCVFDQLPSGHPLFAADDDASIVLDGVDFKFDPFLTVLDEGLDSVGLDGGSLCTRIYPCLDRGHPQFLEPAPFDATYDVHVSEFEKSRAKVVFSTTFFVL